MRSNIYYKNMSSGGGNKPEGSNAKGRRKGTVPNCFFFIIFVNQKVLYRIFQYC